MTEENNTDTRKYVTGTELGAVILLKERFGKLHSTYTKDLNTNVWYTRLNKDAGTGPFVEDEEDQHTYDCCSILRSFYTDLLTSEQVAASTTGVVDKAYLQALKNSKRLTETVKGRRAIMELACQGRDSMGIKGSRWDTKENQLALRDQILNIEDGKVFPRPYNNSDFIRNFVDIAEYDPEAKCPKFLDMLNKIFLGDKEQVNYLKVLIGYSLLQTGTESIFCPCIGKGSNGKSCLVSILSNVFGSLVASLPVETIMTTGRGTNASNARPDLLLLQGKSIIIATEPNEGCRLNAGIIKSITGHDSLAARELYAKKHSVFVPKGVLFLQSNYWPHLDAQDQAILRRIVPFSFKAHFVDNPDPNNPTEFKRDKNIAATIVKEERAGIINFFVEGAREYQLHGLPPLPAAVVATKNEYVHNEDTVQLFIEDCCEISADKESVGDGKQLIYKAFKDWSISRGEHPMSASTLYKKIEAKGFVSWRNAKCVFFRSLKLKECALDNIAVLAKYATISDYPIDLSQISATSDKSDNIDITTSPEHDECVDNNKTLLDLIPF